MTNVKLRSLNQQSSAKLPHTQVEITNPELLSHGTESSYRLLSFELLNMKLTTLLIFIATRSLATKASNKPDTSTHVIATGLEDLTATYSVITFVTEQNLESKYLSI